ncbi:AbgT family transporter, partial [Vibrio cholerae]
EVNWYFMAASTFVIAILGAFVTEKIVEPKLGKYDVSEASDDLSQDKMGSLTALEKKALAYAGLAVVVVSALLAWTIVPADGVLRGE